MRRPALAFLPALMILLPVLAFAQPAIIPHSSDAPQDATATYELLRNYLSDSAHTSFKLVSKDPSTHTLVAKRSGIDTQTWNQWAYCKLGPEHMLDTLTDGSVTVTVKVRPTPTRGSFVTVSADFEATYALGSSESTNQCISNGVLENDLLRVVGAKPAST